MNTKLRPRRSQGYMLTKAGFLVGASLLVQQEVDGNQIARETCLLHDCLHKLEALTNSGMLTNSQELQSRLRAVLDLPQEVADEVPEAPLCSGCGAYVDDGCQCGNYPPDGWREEELLTYCREECDRLQLPTLAERLADSMRDDRR